MTETDYKLKIHNLEKQIATLRVALSAERKFNREILASINEKLENNLTTTEFVGRINKLIEMLKVEQAKSNDFIAGDKAPAFKEVPVEAITRDYITGLTWAQLEKKYGLSNVTMRNRLIQLGIYDEIKAKRREYIKRMKGGV